MPAIQKGRKKREIWKMTIWKQTICTRRRERRGKRLLEKLRFFGNYFENGKWWNLTLARDGYKPA
jgi:hypothetical protein